MTYFISQKNGRDSIRWTSPPLWASGNTLIQVKVGIPFTDVLQQEREMVVVVVVMHVASWSCVGNLSTHTFSSQDRRVGSVGESHSPGLSRHAQRCLLLTRSHSHGFCSAGQQRQPEWESHPKARETISSHTKRGQSLIFFFLWRLSQAGNQHPKVRSKLKR